MLAHPPLPRIDSNMCEVEGVCERPSKNVLGKVGMPRLHISDRTCMLQVSGEQGKGRTTEADVGGMREKTAHSR